MSQDTLGAYLPIGNARLGQSGAVPWIARLLLAVTGIAGLAAGRHAWLDAPRASEEAKRFGYQRRAPWVYRVGAVGLMIGGLVFLGLAVFAG